MGVDVEGHLDLWDTARCRRNTIEERVDPDLDPLRSLALRPKTLEGMLVPSQVFSAVLALEVLRTDVDNTVIEAFAAQVRAASCRLYLEDTVLDG